MAAAVQVVFAEVLNELQVVEAISQRHVLLQADIWEGRGSHEESRSVCDVSMNRMIKGAVVV